MWLDFLNVLFYSGYSGALPDGDVDYAFFSGSDTAGDSLDLPPTTDWSMAKSISLMGWKVHGVRLWFSQGCQNKVLIRIHYNGTSWLPEAPYSDYYVGDDLLLYIPVDRVISDNDKVDVYFWNQDQSNHLVEVKFDMIREREWEEKTPLDLMVAAGRGNMPSYDQATRIEGIGIMPPPPSVAAAQSVVLQKSGQTAELRTSSWPRTSWLTGVRRPGDLLRSIGRLGGLFK